MSTDKRMELLNRLLKKDGYELTSLSIYDPKIKISLFEDTNTGEEIYVECELSKIRWITDGKEVGDDDL